MTSVILTLPSPQEAREKGEIIFTFGSDSHATNRDYADIERAKAAVRAMGGKYQASFCQREKTLWRL